MKIISKKTGKPFVPHKAQLAVLRDKHRYRIVIAGRRWGKTLLGLVDLLFFCLENSGKLCFWVVPKYKHLIPVSDAIREWVPHEIIKTEYQLQQTYRYLEFPNGSRVWFHSCEDEQSLRGPGLDYVVLEEAAQMKENVWPAIIHPELIDSRGKALLISTPLGRNWLYQEFLKAKSGKYPEYACWQRPSSDRLTAEQIEQECRGFPLDVVRQEFYAEFIESGGSVFRGVRRCFKGDIDETFFNVLRYSDGMRLVPKQVLKGKYVYIGVDVGRHEAFTVYLALDEDGNLVGFERFRRLDFPYQKERLLAFLEHFPRREIAMDARGLGSSFFEELKQEGVYIEPVVLTNQSKNSVIHNLVIAIDDMKIRGPFIGELVEELEAFSYRISSSGNVIYEAPENFYDDTVMCYDDKTEVFTKKGWKLFKDLSGDDLIATRNPESKALEFQKPTRIISKEYDGMMLHIKDSNEIDLLVTPNHRMLVKRHLWGRDFTDEQVLSAEEIFNKHCKFIKWANWVGEDKETFQLPNIEITSWNKNWQKQIPPIKMALWMEFLGYYLSEGWSGNNRVVIAQRKNSKAYERIKHCLEQLPIDFKEEEKMGGFVIYSKQLSEYLQRFGKAWQKWIPDEVKEASPRLLRIFLEAYLVGDGHRNAIITSSKRMVDDLTEVILKSGKGVNCFLMQKKGHKHGFGDRTIKTQHDCYRVSIILEVEPEVYHHKTWGSKYEWQNYQGMVYCVSVPNGIIFVKRNGKTVFCGNSLAFAASKLHSKATDWLSLTGESYMSRRLA